MFHKSNKTIQAAVREWVDVACWERPFAATLTLKQRIMNGSCSSPWGTGLTPDIAARNLRHFINLLNRAIFGQAAKRYGRGVRVLPVLEGEEYKRLHYHLVIDCPTDALVEAFPEMIKSLWRTTDWGHAECNIKPCDQGWLNYITKLRDKSDFGMAIDWMNASNLT